VIVEIRHLTKQYGAAIALKDVSLSIEGGGVVGLLGPNGAGKTTLVETLEGLQTPTSGSVAVLGYDPTRQARALRERIGVQLQQTALPQELTPLETLRLFAAFFRKSLPPARVLDTVRLADRAGVRNDRLSLGQRQRLAIGVALINDPELILLDEPTEGLDAEARREIHRHIETLRESGRTVLLTTHYIEEADVLCDRVIVLRAGEVIADGSPAELAAPAGPATLRIVLRGRFDAAPLLKAGAVARSQVGEERHFTAADPRAATLALGTLLQLPEVTLVDLRLTRPTLEDVYLRLMGVESTPRPEERS
jgi:ABC-2 type transport system ATP-binding protein